jgi:hypothetical protein
MFVKQISLFLENRSGRLHAATAALAGKQINIHALSLADTADFGILRLIVDDTDAATQALKAAGFTVIVNDVVAVGVEDKPGGLDAILDVLETQGINVEYMYAFSSVATGDAALVFRFEDNNAAVKTLMQADVGVLDKVAVFGR